MSPGGRRTDRPVAKCPGEKIFSQITTVVSAVPSGGDRHRGSGAGNRGQIPSVVAVCPADEREVSVAGRPAFG
jgi:hypothetical protein